MKSKSGLSVKYRLSSLPLLPPVERLSSLEEFQKQKDKLMSHMESLEKQLAAQREEHKDDIHSLEMKALLEKKR